jgi:hypothetical protein
MKNCPRRPDHRWRRKNISEPMKVMIGEPDGFEADLFPV